MTLTRAALAPSDAAVQPEAASRAWDRVGVLGLVVALLAYAALAAGYVTLTPIWQNPDEPAHYNYVAFVAQTDGLPELRPGNWNSALLERLKNGRLQPGDSVDQIRYESWQPPLFYLLAAPVYRLGPTSDPPAVLTRLRALDAVIGAITLGVAYLFGRRVLAPPLAVAVPLTMVGIPMFTAVSAALSADPLANLFAALLVLVLVQRLQQPRIDGERWALLTGGLLGLGLMTKLELGIFVPLILGVVWLRTRRPLRAAAILLVIAGLLSTPWLVHQVTTYGWTDPFAVARHAAVAGDQKHFAGFSFDWLGQFLTVSFHSFWAQFGWMAVVAPVRLYVIWGVVSLAALGGLIRVRQQLTRPEWRLALACVAIAVVAYVGYNFAFEQFQARYVFTALVPIAGLLVLGWNALLPRRAPPWGVFVLVAALIALNVYTLVRVLVPGFTPILA